MTKSKNSKEILSEYKLSSNLPMYCLILGGIYYLNKNKKCKKPEPVPPTPVPPTPEPEIISIFPPEFLEKDNLWDINANSLCTTVENSDNLFDGINNFYSLPPGKYMIYDIIASITNLLSTLITQNDVDKINQLFAATGTQIVLTEEDFKYAFAQSTKNLICNTLENVEITITDELNSIFTDILFIPIKNATKLTFANILLENNILDSNTNENEIIKQIIIAYGQLNNIDLSAIINLIPFVPSVQGSGIKGIQFILKGFNVIKNELPDDSDILISDYEFTEEQLQKTFTAGIVPSAFGIFPLLNDQNLFSFDILEELINDKGSTVSQIFDILCNFYIDDADFNCRNESNELDIPCFVPKLIKLLGYLSYPIDEDLITNFITDYESNNVYDVNGNTKAYVEFIKNGYLTVLLTYDVKTFKKLDFTSYWNQEEDNVIKNNIVDILCNEEYKVINQGIVNASLGSLFILIFSKAGSNELNKLRTFLNCTPI